MLTYKNLKAISNNTGRTTIMQATVRYLPIAAELASTTEPWRMAHWLSQMCHESNNFKTTREYASGEGYEGRRDLGNVNPGDGVAFRGRGLMQITGRRNYTAFSKWASRSFWEDSRWTARYAAYTPPDFLERPALLEHFPWALIASSWYWAVGNPIGKNLNVYADRNDIEMVTRRINGGLNGYSHRLTCYTTTALVLLGYPSGHRNQILAFQREQGLVADGISGPRTRAALHAALKSS